MIPTPYAVFYSNDVDYYVVEIWNSKFQKYVVGYVFNGLFRSANEHLLKRELAESWSDLR